MSTMNTDLESAIDRAIKRRRAADAGVAAPGAFESRVSESIARVRRQKIGYVAGGPGGIPGAKEGAAPAQAPDPWAFGAPDFTPPTSDLDPQTIRSMLAFKQQVKAMGGNIDGKSDAEVMALMQSYAQNAGNTIGAHDEQTTAIDEFSRGLRRGVAYGLPAGLEFVREMRENEQVQRAPEGMAGFAGETLGGFAGLLDPGKAPQNAAAIWFTGGLGKIAQPVIGRIASVAGNRVANAVSEAILNAGQGGGMAALEEAGKIPVEEWQRDWQGSLARIGKAAGVGSVAAGGLGAAFGSMRAGTPHQYAPTLPERVAPDAGAPIAEQRQINLAQQAAADAARTVAEGQTAMRDAAQAFNQGPRIIDPNAPDSAIVPDQGGWQGDPLARQTFQQINETRSPEATLAASTENPLAELLARRNTTPDTARAETPNATNKETTNGQAQRQEEGLLRPQTSTPAAKAPEGAPQSDTGTSTVNEAELSPKEWAEKTIRESGDINPSDVVGFTPAGTLKFKRGSPSAATRLGPRRAIKEALAAGQRVNADLLDGYNQEADPSRRISLPDGYVREGDFYQRPSVEGSPQSDTGTSTGPISVEFNPATGRMEDVAPQTPQTYDELVKRAKGLGVYRDGPKTRAALVERVSAAETRSAQGTPTPESPESASAGRASEASTEKTAPAQSDRGSSPNPTRQPWEMTREEWIGDGKAGKIKFGDVDQDTVTSPEFDTPEEALAWANSRGIKNASTQSSGKRGGPKKYTASGSAGWHRDAVDRALSEGRAVPPEVLKDYPDLAANAKPPTPAEAGTTPAGTEAARVEAPKASGKPTAQNDLSAVAMAKGRNTAARISPAPVTGKQPKSLSQILSDVEDGLGLRIRKGGVARRSLGTYFPGSQRTSIRRANDLDTAIHEIAHRLDDEYGIVGKWTVAGQNSPFDGELLRPELQHTTKKGYSLSQRRAEGVAEWVRAWTMNPAQAEQIAPKFSDWFKKNVPAEKLRAIRSFSDDVRALAGARPEQKIAANVQFTDPTPGIGARLKEGVRGDTTQDFRYTLADRLATQLVDELHPMMKAIDYARELRGADEPLPSQDSKKLASLWRGFDSKSEQVMLHGPITASGERVQGLGGLDWLVEPMRGKTKAESDANARTVAAYMISERIVEKGEQIIRQAQDKISQLPATAPAKLRADILNAAVDRASRLFSATGGMESDLTVARATITDLMNHPERLQMARESAQRYRSWGKAVLQYMVDKGRLSQESMNRIVNSNEFYVSFKRLTDSVSGELFGAKGGRALGSKKETIGRFKGGTETVQNPWVSLMENTHAMMREADRNEALRAFTDEISQTRKMYDGSPVDMDQIGSRAATEADDTIPIFTNGKRENWNFHPAIYKALKNWGGDPQLPTIAKVWTVPVTIMREAITKSFGFVVRNPIRDAGTRAVVSDVGSKPWGGLYYLFHPGEFKTDSASMKLTGGGFFPENRPTTRAYYGALRDAMHKAASDRSIILATPRTVWRGLNRLTNVSENAGRLSEWRAAYKKAIDSGMSDVDARIEATHQARSLLDFGRSGRTMKYVNQFVPFSNAGMQGLMKTLSTAVKHPARTAARMAIWLGVPIALEKLYSSVTGTDEEHRQLPAWQRDFFFNFKVGSSWLAIPKPYDLGVVASGFDRAWDYAKGDPEAFSGYGGSLVRGVLPIGMEDAIAPGTAKLAIELATNHDFFRDAPIVPPWEEDKDLSLREGQKSASRIGQDIGKAVSVDARNVDHFIRSIGGGWADSALRASDIGREDKPNAATSMLTGLSGLVRQDAGPNQRDFRSALDEMRRRGMENTTTYRRMANLATRFKLSKDENERRQLSAQMREVGSDMLARLRNTEIGQTRTARRK